MSKQRRIKPRNWDALNPTLGKGGVHEKTNKAKRQKLKRQLARQLASSGREPDSLPQAA